MLTTILRKVGGSVMLAVPPAILDSLGMRGGSEVTLSVDGGNLVVKPVSTPRYTLDELLAQCDPDAPIGEEDREWLDAAPAGKEIL